MVALADVGDARADRLDDAGRLVTERHRHRSRARSVHDGEVGVAEPGGGDANQQLAVSGRRQLELLDAQRAALLVGPLGAEVAQNRRARDHERNSATVRLNLSGDSRKRRWPPPANRSKRAPGIRRASSTPFSYGTIRSASPWTTSVGASICSTGETCSTKRQQASYWARQHSGGVGYSSRSARSCSNSSGMLVRPARARRRAASRRARTRAAGGRRSPPRSRSSRPGCGSGSGRRCRADEHKPFDELADAGARASGRCSRPSRSRRRAADGLRVPRRRRRPAPRSSTAPVASASGRRRDSRRRSRGSSPTRPGSGAATTRSRTRARR